MHLFERECSIQRRHQKLLEECPSTALDRDAAGPDDGGGAQGGPGGGLRQRGHRRVPARQNGEFYFIEMNTRIQVEHPVTEMVTGIDLIKEQIRDRRRRAAELHPGRRRHHGPRDRVPGQRRGSRDNFMPSPGKITTFHPPGGPGIRLDTACYAEAVVPPYYDSMIAKVIARGNTRGEAILRMRRALESFVVEGIKTNIPLQQRILAEEDFVRGRLSTAFMERFLPRKTGTRPS